MPMLPKWTHPGVKCSHVFYIHFDRESIKQYSQSRDISCVPTPSANHLVLLYQVCSNYGTWSKKVLPRGLHVLYRFFSSSYCDRCMSGVLRAAWSLGANNCFKGHLLLNYWLDLDQTWQQSSLYSPLKYFFK